tara:strand:+ start:26284 stop:27705 length:1422 start_codon:yes stop_codon:yes gene_type:complete
MSLQTGINQPLRFYDNIYDQDRFKRGALGGFKLLSPNNILIPFQIVRMGSVGPIMSLKLVDIDTGIETEILDKIPVADMDAFYFLDTDYLVYYGQLALVGLIIPIGPHYLKVTDLNNTWFSEVITFFDSSQNCTTILEYGDTQDVANFLYRTEELGGKKYYNKIYLDLELSKPNYEYTEEGEENLRGEFIPELKRVEKQYKLEGVFPEYFLDALVLLPLHISETGFIVIKTRNNKVADISELLISDPVWQDDFGTLALTEISFAVNFSLKINCDEPVLLSLPFCLRGLTKVKAKVVQGSTDYNNFEYTDLLDLSKKPFISGDLVLIDNSGTLTVKEFGSSSYNALLVPLAGHSIYDDNAHKNPASNESIYYFFDANNASYTDQPVIYSADNTIEGVYEIAGISFDNSLVHVLAYNTDLSVWQTIRTVIGSTFNSGVTVLSNASFSLVKLLVIGSTCTLHIDSPGYSGNTETSF